MRKEQKPAIIKNIVYEKLSKLTEEEKAALSSKLGNIILNSNVACSTTTFENTIGKLINNPKLPLDKTVHMIYKQIMLSDDDTIIDVYFNKKENGVYVDEDELSDVIASCFDFSRVPMPAIKNSLRSYMKKVGITTKTLKSYLERVFALSENLCIEKSLMSFALYKYPELMQQSDWQYKYIIFAKIIDRKREDLILDRSAFVPSCQLLYSKIKMLEYLEEKEGEEIPKSYGKIITLKNELFYDRYVKDKIPISRDKMKYFCPFEDDRKNILPEALEDILSWEGNEEIKERFCGTPIS